MNYYEHHIGDYDQATAHLTACEDGIYSRLIRWYYASEAPLPADLKVIQRRVRAHSRDERAAVQTVLAEFFELQDDGYHQHRCDEVIASYHEAVPEMEAKRENARERQRRARERRAELFEALRGHNVVPRFDTTTRELERLLSRATSQQPSQTGSRDVTLPVTRDDTATHFPLPTSHEESASALSARAPTPAGEVGKALVDAGIPPTMVNLSDPVLLALIAQGATPAEFAGLAAEAIRDGKQKPMAWVLAVLPRRREDAAKLALKPREGTGKAPPTWAEQRDAQVAAYAGPAAAKKSGESPANPSTAEVIDVTARRVG